MAFAAAWNYVLLVCVLVTVLVIGWTLVGHVRGFVRPALQKCYMRICFMSPIFAVFAYLSFTIPAYGVFFEALRGLVEAYALYCFYAAMMLFAGGETRVAKMVEGPTRRWHEEYKWSVCCGLIRWRYGDGRGAVKMHKICVGQLIITKTLFTFIIALLALNEHTDNIKAMIVTLAVGNFLCMLILMRTLLVVYQITYHALNGMKAVTKFAVIKLMVFITVTQQFVISILQSSGGIEEESGYDVEETASRIQAFIGIIEMLFFAFVFAWSFSARDSSLFVPHSALPKSGEAERATGLSPRDVSLLEGQEGSSASSVPSADDYDQVSKYSLGSILRIVFSLGDILFWPLEEGYSGLAASESSSAAV